jgi:hypothetical protein
MINHLSKLLEAEEGTKEATACDIGYETSDYDLFPLNQRLNFVMKLSVSKASV